jgi:integrase
LVLARHRDLPAGKSLTARCLWALGGSNARRLLRRSFYPLCARASIPTRPGLRFHDLRHACGSLLIAEGVRPKLVQAILRHSKLATTMDLYVHSFDDDLRGAVASLDRALGS